MFFAGIMLAFFLDSYISLYFEPESWNRWTSIKSQCFIRLASSTSCIFTWGAEQLDSPNSVKIQEWFWGLVLTPWYLLGFFPNPCQEIVYAVISLTALLVEKHLVKHCGCPNAKHRDALKEECAEDQRSVSILLWGFSPFLKFFFSPL